MKSDTTATAVAQMSPEVARDPGDAGRSYSKEDSPEGYLQQIHLEGQDLDVIAGRQR